MAVSGPITLNSNILGRRASQDLHQIGPCPDRHLLLFAAFSPPSSNLRPLTSFASCNFNEGWRLQSSNPLHQIISDFPIKCIHSRYILPDCTCETSNPQR